MILTGEQFRCELNKATLFLNVAFTNHLIATSYMHVFSIASGLSGGIQGLSIHPSASRGLGNTAQVGRVL